MKRKTFGTAIAEPTTRMFPSVYLVRSRSQGFLCRKIEDRFHNKGENPFSVFNSANDLICGIQTFPEAALIIINVETSADFRDLCAILNWFQRMEWNWSSQILVLDKMGHPSLQAALIKRGCSVIDQLDRKFVAISSVIDRNLALLETRMGTALPTSYRELGLMADDLPKFELIWTDSFTVQNDDWQLPLGRFIYQKDQYWLISLSGPSPSAGSWQRLDQASNDLESRWKWVPEGAAAPADPGQWEFFGMEPRFESNRWIFVGSLPKLEFAAKESIPSVRFMALDTKRVQVAPNSSTLSLTVQKTKNAAQPKKRPKKSNLFKPIESEKKIQKVLEEAFSSRRSIRIWYKGSLARFNAQFGSVPTSLERVILKLKNPEERAQLKKEAIQASRRGEPQLLGKFCLASGAVFITAECNLEAKSSGGLSLLLDGPAFVVQRRSRDRFKIPAERLIEVTIDNEVRRIINIGSGGLAFTASPEDADLYFQDKIVQLHLELYGQGISVESEIRWAKLIETPAGEAVLGVGLRFASLSKTLKGYLDLLLFELSLAAPSSGSGEES